MYDFISFLRDRNFDLYYHHLEVVLERSVAEVESNPPKDGAWIDPYHFGFNVEGDEENLGHNERRYMVNFNDKKNPSISFSRNNLYRDNRGSFGTQVFNGVFYAIWNFIKNNSPDTLRWSPITKTSVNPKTGQVHNPEGREKAYEIFAIKSLFPDYYVSVEKNNWIKRSLYDQQMISRGFPEIPKELTVASKSSEKTQFLEKIRNKKVELSNIVANRSEPNQSEPSRSSGRLTGQNFDNLRTASSRSIEIIRTRNSLQVGDAVLPAKTEEQINNTTSIFYQQNPNSLRGLDRELQNLFQRRIPIKGKIIQLYELPVRTHRGEGEETQIEVSFLYGAKVKFDGSESEFLFYIQDLIPYSEQEANKINNLLENPIQMYINDRQYNRNAFKVGDKVIHKFGYVGKISKIYFSDQQGDRRLMMDVVWNWKESLPNSRNPQQTKFYLDDNRILQAVPSNMSMIARQISPKGQPAVDNHDGF